MSVDLLPNYIEIETSTYCNRNCRWCPNIKYERSEKQKLIEPKLFAKIIDDLQKVEFSNKIALHNYNEPLLDPNLFGHIEIINKNLPDAQILILTNGDFLNKKYLEKISNYKVSLLRITLYDPIEKEDVEEAVKRHMKKSGIMKQPRDISDDFGTKCRTSYGKMDVVYYIPNFEMFTSRAGLVENHSKKRNNRCFLPFSSSAIDYEGNVKICCEVYPEDPLHKAHGIIGNLRDGNFADFWFSDQYNEMRIRMISDDIKNPLCLSCKNKPKNALEIDEKKLQEWKKYLGV